MGCSMGGGVAMDFALTYPSRMKAIIMVGAGPSGLKLDVTTHLNLLMLRRLSKLEIWIWWLKSKRKFGSMAWIERQTR